MQPKRPASASMRDRRAMLTQMIESARCDSHVDAEELATIEHMPSRDLGELRAQEDAFYRLPRHPRAPRYDRTDTPRYEPRPGAS